MIYWLSSKLGLDCEPTVAIAAGLVMLLAGLSLVGSVGDVIPGAPVTAAVRFFELVMMTAATIAGVALVVLHLANRFGAVRRHQCGAASTVVFLLSQGAGLGTVVASFAAAVLIGPVGRLMERRNLAPPPVVSIAGILPLLRGLALLHGIYAILNQQHAVGFASVLSAPTIGTAPAAGATLGEWSSRRVRRRRVQARRRSRGV